MLIESLFFDDRQGRAKSSRKATNTACARHLDVDESYQDFSASGVDLPDDECDVELRVAPPMMRVMMMMHENENITEIAFFSRVVSFCAS